MRACLIIGCWLIVSAVAEAQTKLVVPLKTDAPTKSEPKVTEPVDVNFGWKLDKPQTHSIKIGMVITAQTVCRGLSATTPVPIEWPEQQVRITNEEFSPYARGVSYRMVGLTAKQMVLNIPNLPANDRAEALVTFEITKSAQLPPDDTKGYQLPELKKLKTETRVYLGPSPFIETTNPKFLSTAKDALKGKEGAWENVETLYDWTRANVEFRHGPLKGAMQSMKDGFGDAEEVVGVFVGLCRVSDIPARMVWVPGHVYAEFYLTDEDGKGYWFPAQVAGNREFGGISDYRPILMKGDSFVTLERPKDRQRFIAEYLTGAGGKPSVRFVRDMVD